MLRWADPGKASGAWETLAPPMSALRRHYCTAAVSGGVENTNVCDMVKEFLAPPAGIPSHPGLCWNSDLWIPCAEKAGKLHSPKVRRKAAW